MHVHARVRAMNKKNKKIKKILKKCRKMFDIYKKRCYSIQAVAMRASETKKTLKNFPKNFKKV